MTLAAETPEFGRVIVDASGGHRYYANAAALGRSPTSIRQVAADPRVAAELEPRILLAPPGDPSMPVDTIPSPA